MDEYKDGTRRGIVETCLDSFSVDEPFTLAGEYRRRFLRNLARAV